jgi:flavorubredoxin
MDRALSGKTAVGGEDSSSSNGKEDGMESPFTAAKITDRVYWVGAVDWGIRDFHGYSTNRGSTYNAYLILAEKVTLVDTVKAAFRDEMFARIASVIDPAKIRYVVSNHSEMDHSGCLPDVVERVKPEKVFASTMGAKALAEHFHLDRDITAVKDGETLGLGDAALTFVETRMVHWPDSMFSYLADEGVLFSQDGFGMHLASSERFADEIDKDVLEFEAAKYYANILMPFSPLIQKLLKKVAGLGISVKVLAPDHGPIWREDTGRMLETYGRWAEQKPTKKAVVVYATMWQSTALMARTIADGLAGGGVSARVLPLGSSHRSDVATEILDAGALLVGSPTINTNLFPTVADVLAYLKGLKPQNLIGQAFGSYGWSGEAVGLIGADLGAMKVEMVGEGLRVKYVPDGEGLARCRGFGMEVARALRERCDG